MMQPQSTMAPQVTYWEKTPGTASGFTSVPASLIAQDGRPYYRRAKRDRDAWYSVLNAPEFKEKNSEAIILGLKASYACSACGRRGHQKPECPYVASATAPLINDAARTYILNANMPVDPSVRIEGAPRRREPPAGQGARYDGRPTATTTYNGSPGQGRT